jgi:CubicO group peptidase (beta-lactamase class C family)
MNSNPSGFSSQRLERLTRLFWGYIKRGELPCASAMVVHNGVTAYREKFGCADIEADKPLEYDSIFRIMSMTKPITAVAAMLLYEEGYFDLNTPIHRFLPEFKEMKVLSGHSKEGQPVLEPARGPITFRHLFTHTSGLSYGGVLEDPLDRLYMQALNPQEENAVSSIRDFATRLAQLPLAFQPGTRFRYGFNLDLLGALVEVISGLPLEVFFRERIFQLLEMPDTGFNLPHEKLPRLVTLYSRNPETGELNRREVPLPMMVSMWGGGGLVSTLDDYSHFCSMLANQGEWHGVQFLSRTTVAMFSTNWAAPEALPSFWETGPEINGGYGYSLGTAVLLDPAPTGKFGNPGEFYWGGAFSTYFWIDPKESLYGLFMTQLDPNWAYPIPWQFKQLTYQAMSD